MGEKRPKKLLLNKETIATLNDDELGQVAGATTTWWCLSASVVVSVTAHWCPSHKCHWTGIPWVC